jgi:hypothetical protein
VHARRVVRCQLVAVHCARTIDRRPDRRLVHAAFALLATLAIAVYFLTHRYAPVAASGGETGPKVFIYDTWTGKLVRVFQATFAPRLSALLGGIEVIPEWRAMAGQEGVYSPRLDLAVGPFAVGHDVYVHEYHELVDRYGAFLHLLYERSIENMQRFGHANDATPFNEVIHRNDNSRCFLAIEIENLVSRKHLMGGAINAAALGRVGIAVGWTERMVRAFVKLRAYLLYLASVGKNTFHPFNLLIVSREQFAQVVEEFEARQRAGVATNATRA